MSETNETADKTAQGRKPLSLKRTVDSGFTFSKSSAKGRSKSVVVEKEAQAHGCAAGGLA